MASLDLRDISERLSRSQDAEGVVFELLGYLQSGRGDWRASLAFFDARRDAITDLYQRQGERLVRREIALPVDHLPARLVRKFFHPSAFFNHANRRSVLAALMQSSPAYEPGTHEAASLAPIAPISNWLSCVVLPLNDREDVLALLVVASTRKGAFDARAMSAIIPVQNLAALAVTRNLRQPSADGAPVDDERRFRAAAAEFQDQIRQLTQHAADLEADNHAKKEKVEALLREIRDRDESLARDRGELERVRTALRVLEYQTAEATDQLSEAYSKLEGAQQRVDEFQRTLRFTRDVFEAMSKAHRPDSIASTLLGWFCEHFAIERCSLMLVEDDGSLRIAAFRGIAPSVVGEVSVQVGQGIAGWVAANRKPLFIRRRGETRGVNHTDQDDYNSDSFISVPLIHNEILVGVLNVSNKKDGQAFSEVDLERAVIAGSVLAMALDESDA